MGKNKSCTPAERKVIVELQKTGLSYQHIATRLNCSKSKVFGAISHFQKYETTEDVPRKQRPRKTTKHIDKKIVQLSKEDPKKTATAIYREIIDENNIELSKRTVARRLVEAGLHAHKVVSYQNKTKTKS